jgi:5-methylcytosine-specific restriction endonuclease McrA
VSQLNQKPEPRRSSRWPAVARAHLAQFPRCAACGRDDDCVPHHRVPVHVDPSLELEPDNLVTLCEGKTLNCHLYFGHLGDWRSWNPTVNRDAQRFRSRVKTRPYKTDD